MDPLSFDIDYYSVKDLKYLSSGSMCQVYTGVWNQKNVVVKFPRREKLQVAARDLDIELQMMQLFDHPNICKIYGAGQTPEGLTFICMEALTEGTLAKYLGTDSKPEGKLVSLGHWIAKSFFISLSQVLKHAVGIASALNYLHNEAIPGARIMHRDFKSSNMAFDSTGTIKLFDFGLSKILKDRDRIENDRYMLTGNTGSLRYMAPEGFINFSGQVALCQPYDEKADVYSFGILLWELCSLKRPYEHCSVADFRRRVTIGGERPEINVDWPVRLQDLMKKCWAHCIDARPDMAFVKGELQETLLELER